MHVMEATIGGTRRHIVDVAREQQRRGLDVELVVATRRDPDFSSDLAALEAQGVRVERLEMTREIRPGRDFADWHTLKRLLRGHEPDIVHTHSSKAGVLGRMASISTGVGRRVHTPHTFAFLFEALFGKAKRTAYRRIESWLARRTERVIAVSESEAQTFEASGVVPADRIRIVANGIDPAPYAEVSALDVTALGLDPARPTVAVIGLVYAAKGQDLALEALASTDAAAELQLLIVGPGDTSALEMRARELGLTQRVRFLGARRDVPAILAALEFLILPSRWEGMPYIVMEAMASRLPVVATPVDGARELVLHGRTGFLADSIESVPALTQALEAMCALSADERSAFGERAHARLAAGYSQRSMVDGLIAVYEELL